jgi:hypothetical protein
MNRLLIDEFPGQVPFCPGQFPSRQKDLHAGAGAQVQDGFTFAEVLALRMPPSQNGIEDIADDGNPHRDHADKHANQFGL